MGIADCMLVYEYATYCTWGIGRRASPLVAEWSDPVVLPKELLMVSRETITTAILEYVAKNFMGNKAADIPLDRSLVEEGIIDSYAIIELIEFLESSFDVIVPDEDVTKDNFGSVERMANYLSGVAV